MKTARFWDIPACASTADRDGWHIVRNCCRSWVHELCQAIWKMRPRRRLNPAFSGKPWTVNLTTWVTYYLLSPKLSKSRFIEMEEMIPW